MRGAMLRHTCVVCGCPERESTNSWKRMSASTRRSSSPSRAPSAIIQTSFASSAKSASSICSSALREAEALEREADRDQHLLDLLLGDAEHDRAAVGVRDDEALVLELLQRLAHGAAARLQLARDPLLDQPLAVGERPTVIASRRESTTCSRRGLRCLPALSGGARAPSAAPSTVDRLDVRRIRLLRSKPLLTI